jgi:formylglycine-generating enzyme required for sulfatase activity
METNAAADSPASRARSTIVVATALFMLLPVGLFYWMSRTPAVDPANVCKMVWIPGGEFRMGTVNVDDKHKEEGPAHNVQVKGFWMDETEVTNSQFAAFVQATGYVTEAEKDLSAQEFPNAPAEYLKGGSLIFKRVQGVDPFQCGTSGNLPWWKFTAAATWRTPEGPGSTIEQRMNYPVLCLTWNDVHAFATWAGKRLPTEAEWEFAARGGLKDMPYVWGKEERPNGKYQCNHWQGTFPANDTGVDGFKSVAPVASFPPNGYGLYDVAGNVWEMCEDWYHPDFYKVSPAVNPLGPTIGFDPEGTGYGQHVIRGGSWLCDEGYCFRYRATSRQGLDKLTSTNHAGFRCVADRPAPGAQK